MSITGFAQHACEPAAGAVRDNVYGPACRAVHLHDGPRPPVQARLRAVRKIKFKCTSRGFRGLKKWRFEMCFPHSSFGCRFRIAIFSDRDCSALTPFDAWWPSGSEACFNLFHGVHRLQRTCVAGSVDYLIESLVHAADNEELFRSPSFKRAYLHASMAVESCPQPCILAQVPRMCPGRVCLAQYPRLVLTSIFVFACCVICVQVSGWWVHMN